MEKWSGVETEKEQKNPSIDMRPPWRSGLACWTSILKVVGSSLTGGGIFSS